MDLHTDAVLAHRDGGSNSRHEFPALSCGILRMPLYKTCFVNLDPHIASCLCKVGSEQAYKVRAEYWATRSIEKGE